jgi:hypothetical protein
MTEVLSIFLFIGYLILTITLTSEGSERKIGWFFPLLVCIIATPLAGAIVVALSKRKADEAHEIFMRENIAKINNRVAVMVGDAEKSAIA